MERPFNDLNKEIYTLGGVPKETLLEEAKILIGLNQPITITQCRNCDNCLTEIGRANSQNLHAL